MLLPLAMFYQVAKGNNIALRNWKFRKAETGFNYFRLFIMSQSASLYRISLNEFENLKNNGRKNFNLLKSSKEQVTFQQTFMGLEFVLAKDKTEDEKRLMEEIFNPNYTVGGKDLSGYDLTAMDEKEIFNLLEGDTSVFYHPTTRIKSIYEILAAISESAFIAKFDPDELNENRIYPYAWNRNTAPDAVFNERDLLKDFIALKDFFGKASRENDYILCFVG